METITIRSNKMSKAIALAIASLHIFCFSSFSSFSQTNIDSLLGKLDPQKYATSIGEKSKKLEDKLVKESMKTLSSMQKSEEKIFRHLLKTKDSLAAKASLEGVKEKYTSLKEKVSNPAIVNKTKAYLSRLDSLSTSLKFLDANGVGGKVKDALAKCNSLQDKIKSAEEIKQFLKDRKEQLKQQLEKLGMVKQLKQVNKEVFYYAQSLKEMKETLKDPKKIEKKALELLAKTDVFKKFMAKNSMFASLFKMPGDPTDPAYLASLSGLQTRAQVNGLIQQQIQSGGSNAMQQFQQNMQSAQSQLNSLKDQILKKMPGGGSSEDIMPEGFKPNMQKKKSFWDRIELGTNVQSQKSTNYFVTTSDIGLSVGYKLNDRSIVGLGGSFKMGFGRGWDHLRLSSEGLSLRSFIDWKIKGSFFVTGGYEQNYKTAFNSIAVLQNYSAWQKSGLLGVSKTVTTKSKFFKKTKLQFLWDMLSKEQRPVTPSFIYRISYNF